MSADDVNAWLKRYGSPDDVRKLAHSLRDDKILYYRIDDPYKCLSTNNSFESLKDALYFLDDSMYRHQIEGLELFDVGSFKFYRSGDGVIYISMVVALPPEELCSTFNIYDPDESDSNNEDDLTLIMRGESNSSLFNRIQSLIMLIESPYPKTIEECSSGIDGNDKIYLHRLSDKTFMQLDLKYI